ncbi:hypothetical protein [Mycobacterium simulans]|uniref:hypothetical protein n=1 Tax=Mycobacterium simulans TaxID=627089 RepID=UPI0021E51C82|nr:hypothetical protein [Mycobacterium simulans]
MCAGWDIKTVTAHLVRVFADSLWVFMRTSLRRGSMARAIDELARRRARRPIADITWSMAMTAGFRSSSRSSPTRSWRGWR